MAVYKRGDRWHYRFQLGGRQYSGSAGAGAGKAEAIELARATAATARVWILKRHNVELRGPEAALSPEAPSRTQG